ncbi:hypothetical protein DL767_010982 [Monosporascus sp. MG133]|nr:hypothetical protein DL767_010982 [Monosporascus sp. MG133]
MVAFIKSILSLLAIAAFTNAAPTTDADSATVEKRDVSCFDDVEAERASLSGAVECINYLASLGDTPCRGGIGGTAFCNLPGVQITGIADTWQGAESPWDGIANGRLKQQCRPRGWRDFGQVL